MSTIEPKLQVFLCHASQDKPAVLVLYNALKREDWIDPWLDKTKILPGQSWRIEIEKAVEQADVVIVCLSKNSVSKEGYVQKEIKYAYEIALEKPEGTIFLIPLRLEECETPRGLRTLQWVNFFGPEKAEQYDNLIRSLRIRYEQLIHHKTEEIVKRQEEEKQRLVYNEAKRKEQEKEYLFEEQKKKEREEQAKRESAAQDRQRLEKEDIFSLGYTEDLSTNPYEDSPSNSTNTTPAIVGIILALLFVCSCVIFCIVWQFGDAILKSLGLTF